jgi:hypothetical protein
MGLSKKISKFYLALMTLTRNLGPHTTSLVSEINPDSPLPSLSQPYNPLHPHSEPQAPMIMNQIWRRMIMEIY